MPITMKQLLEEMVQRNSTDLHLTTGAPPMFRIDGELVPTNYEIMTPELIEQLTYSVLNDQQKKRFEMEWELDFSFGIAGLSRFRGNCFKQRGSTAAAILYDSLRDPRVQGTGHPPGCAGTVRTPEGVDPADRTHRLRQINNPGRDHR